MNALIPFWILPAVLCSIFFCVEAIAQEEDLKRFQWTTIDAPGDVTERHENAFVEYQGKFYLIGGRGVNPVNVFDPETRTWERRGRSPVELSHFQPVVFENAIYIVGAMGPGYPTEPPLENIWIYYPDTDAWEKGAEIPQERRRGGGGAVLYNDRIYWVCGIENGHTSGTNNYFDSYDLKTGEWEILTKAPHVRDHFQAIVVGDRLYCIGGRNTSVHYEDDFTAFFHATVPYVDVYDFTEQRWFTMREKLPVPTAAGAVVSVGNHILYMGGEAAQRLAHNETQGLNLETGKWTQLAPMNTGRHGTTAIVYNGDIYIAAGSPVRGGGNISSIEVFSAKHDQDL